MFEVKVALGDAIFIATINSEQLKATYHWESKSHFHAEYELHVILEGKSAIEIDGKEFEIGDKEICLIAPKTSHYPKVLSNDLKKVSFPFSLTRNYNYYRDGKVFSEFAHYDNIFKCVKDYALIKNTELFKVIKEIIGQEVNEQNEHVLQTAFASFFIKLAKELKGKYALTDTQIIHDAFENENSLKQRRIVERFFQTRYSEQVGIEDLAKELCLSIPQTHRIIKKIFGVGFKKTLTKQRIALACMLIKKKENNLSEIAYQCGYTSYNGFLSAFKECMGKSPKEYEKTVN